MAGVITRPGACSARRMYSPSCRVGAPMGVHIVQRSGAKAIRAYLMAIKSILSLYGKAALDRHIPWLKPDLIKRFDSLMAKLELRRLDAMSATADAGYDLLEVTRWQTYICQRLSGFKDQHPSNHELEFTQMRDSLADYLGYFKNALYRLESKSWPAFLADSQPAKPQGAPKKIRTMKSRRTHKKTRDRRPRTVVLLLVLLEDRTKANLNYTELAAELDVNVSSVSRAFKHKKYGPELLRRYHDFGIKPPRTHEI